jgi:hypothetical protein
MVYELVLATVAPARRDEYVDVFRKAFRGANFAGAHAGKILRSVASSSSGTTSRPTPATAAPTPTTTSAPRSRATRPSPARLATTSSRTSNRPR